MHSSTTRIICLTHNRSSSFRPKQLPAVPRLTFIPIAKASIFNTSTSKYSRKTIWQPYSYHFPTFFLPFSQKKTIWLLFPSPSPPRIPLDSTSHHGHDPRRGRCHWTRVHDDSSGGGSVKDENDGQKWMQTKCCVYRYYIYIYWLGEVYLPPPMSYFYIENSKEDEQYDNMMCFGGCDVLFFWIRLHWPK